MKTKIKTKIKELKGSASLEGGILTLEDGTTIDLHRVYSVLDELREYADSATPDCYPMPNCVLKAYKLLAVFWDDEDSEP